MPAPAWPLKDATTRTHEITAKPWRGLPRAKQTGPDDATNTAQPLTIKAYRRGNQWLVVNPSSVDYHSFTNPPAVAARPNANGLLDVLIKFSAINAYNATSTSNAMCVTSGDGKILLEISTQPSR